eukprot:GEMP01057220.1.p1 GENE.GEMP01057220.1~~GEMP01057220.1.p1  ORF type:complete len:476 (+),score=120.62 GEMP01057220.1:32-1459(+)
MWRLHHIGRARQRIPRSILGGCVESCDALHCRIRAFSSAASASTVAAASVDVGSGVNHISTGVEGKVALVNHVSTGVEGKVALVNHVSTGVEGKVALVPPPGSTADVLLQRCVEQAGDMGHTQEAYEPWMPVDLMQTLIMSLHESLGCSWFGAIIASAILIRSVTLPLAIKSLRGNREKTLAWPEFDRLIKLQKEAVEDKSDNAQAKQELVRTHMEAFSKKYGNPFFFPWKGSWHIMVFQVPLYITAFRSMRGFADHPHMFPDMALESPLWLESLCLPDATYVLPLLTAGLMLTNLELFGSLDTGATALSDQRRASANSMKKYVPYIVRGSVLMFLPLGHTMPSGLFVFIATNTVTVAMQNRILKHPQVEAFLDMPPLPTEEEKAKLKEVSKQKPLYVWQDEQAKRVADRQRRRREQKEAARDATVVGAVESEQDALQRAPLFEAVVPKSKIQFSQTLDEQLINALSSKYRIQPR